MAGLQEVNDYVRRENTPERILREFQTEAQYGYKIGVPATDMRPVDLSATMMECKDEWDLKAQDLYNKDIKV